MELKKYAFPFQTVLDDDGKEVEMRTATNKETDELLDDPNPPEPEEPQLPPHTIYKQTDYIKSAAQSPSEHLHEMARDEQDVFPDMSYPQAVKRVMARNPVITRLYASENGGKVRVTPMGDFEGEYCNPSLALAEKARTLLDGGDCDTYADACVRVLTEHKTLAARYAQWISNPIHRPKTAPEKTSFSSRAKAKLLVKQRYRKIQKEGLCHG